MRGHLHGAGFFGSIQRLGGSTWFRRPSSPAPRQAATARASTRSFIRSPEWPFTQPNAMSPRSTYRPTSGSHRSRLATGFLAEFVQPRSSQPCHQRSRKQLTTYVESLTTSSGPSFASTASSAARISIRWLVLRASRPEANVVSSSAQAQPPGPGLPEQAPSVQTETAPSGADHVGGAGTAYACRTTGWGHAGTLAAHYGRPMSAIDGVSETSTPPPGTRCPVSRT